MKKECDAVVSFAPAVPAPQPAAVRGRRARTVRWRPPLRRMIGVVAAVVAMLATPLVGAGAAKASPAGVLVAGGQWLQGQGVDVYGNGGNPNTYYQCVELPQMRLYPRFGWPRVYAAGNGGAAYIPEGSPGLVRSNPGSGYVPVPGDLIVENPTSTNPYGHVAVVDFTSGNTINAVEQNASANGRHAYTYNNSWYAGGYGTVKAVMHAPGNTFRNPGSTGFEVAFQANTGNLWSVGSDPHGDWQQGMMAGTSPSITALAGGGYEMAFQANTGSLITIGSAGNRNWGLGMKAGTSPSIAGLSNGSFEVAFQANTGNLWTVGADPHGDWGLGMMTGTSPSIAALPGGKYEVAFQANTGNLWSVGSDPHGDWQQGMMAGTSPSITALAGGGYEMAFQANTGSLITIGSAGNRNWGLGMKAGTSPALTTQ